MALWLGEVKMIEKQGQRYDLGHKGFGEARKRLRGGKKSRAPFINNKRKRSKRERAQVIS